MPCSPNISFRQANSDKEAHLVMWIRCSEGFSMSSRRRCQRARLFRTRSDRYATSVCLVCCEMIKVRVGRTWARRAILLQLVQATAQGPVPG